MQMFISSALGLVKLQAESHVKLTSGGGVISLVHPKIAIFRPLSVYVSESVCTRPRSIHADSSVVFLTIYALPLTCVIDLFCTQCI